MQAQATMLGVVPSLREALVAALIEHPHSSTGTISVHPDDFTALQKQVEGWHEYICLLTGQTPTQENTSILIFHYHGLPWALRSNPAQPVGHVSIQMQ